MEPIKIPVLSPRYSRIPTLYLLSEYDYSIGTRFRVKKEDIEDINQLLNFFGLSSMDYGKSVLVFSDLLLREHINVAQYSRDTFTHSSLFDYITPSKIHVIFIDADHYHTLKVNQVLELFVRHNLGFLTVVRLE